MATQQDRLETYLRMVGGPEYAREMGAAAKATDRMAKAQVDLANIEAASANERIAGATSLGRLAVAYFTVTTAVRAYNTVISAAADAERRSFEAGQVFGNLGRGDFLPKLNALALQMQSLTAIDDDLFISVGKMLAQFGLMDNQITRMIPTLADFARANNLGIEETTRMAERAIRGQGRALEALVGDLKLTKDEAKNFEIVMRALARASGGTAAAFRNTLPGSLEAGAQSSSRFAEALGSRLAPVTTPFREARIRAQNATSEWLENGGGSAFFEGLANIARNLTGETAQKAGENAARRRRGLPARWNLETGQDLLAARAGQAAGTAKGFGQRDSDNLDDMAKSMKKISDGLIQQVLGGGGDAARRVLNIRAAQIALRTT